MSAAGTVSQVDDRLGCAPVSFGLHTEPVARRAVAALLYPGEDPADEDPDAVAAGGNSADSCRALMPPRTMHRISSNSIRQQYFSCPPPLSQCSARLLGAGSSGCRIAHCGSVVDDGYIVQRCLPAGWGGLLCELVSTIAIGRLCEPSIQRDRS